MDSMEVNKAVAAVLVAGIAFFVSGMIGESLVHVTPLKQSAIKIEGGAVEAKAPASGPVVLPPIENLLQTADAGAGEGSAKKLCSACHSFNDGGKAGVGPNLYGVLGGPQAHMAGFAYSNALKGKGKTWTFAELNEWLYKPAAYAPGTKMGFAGIANAQERANVIEYLRTLSAKPEPKPAPVAVVAAAASAAALSAAPPPGDTPIATRLASADAAAGQASTLRLGCIACHTFNEGGRAGLGPNLYGVAGGPHAHMEGYAYSVGMKAKTGLWTDEDLDAWLKKPAAYSPGTKMTFAGIPDAKQRADVIAYLHTLKHP